MLWFVAEKEEEEKKAEDFKSDICVLPFSYWSGMG